MSANTSLRLILKAGSVMLLWLLSVSLGTATPLSRTPAKFCDAKTTTLKKLVRQARAVGGPLAKKRLGGFGIRRHPQNSRIQHGVFRLSHDDDQAIQNDTAATDASIELPIALEAIGAFVDDPDSAASTHVFSPRAPRGPPSAA
jgi:hypothetical protein